MSMTVTEELEEMPALLAEEFRTPADDLRKALSHRHADSFQAASPFTRLIKRVHEGAPFSLSSLHQAPVSFRAWKQNFSRRLEQELQIPGSLTQPSDPRIISEEQHTDFLIQDIEITLTPPLRTVATVVIPRNGQKRHPAIVALHSMGGERCFGREKLMSRRDEPAYFEDYRNTYYDGRSIQQELARQGFLSISVDAFGFGSRAWSPENPTDQDSPKRSDASEEARQLMAFDSAVTKESFALRMLASVGLSFPSLVVTDDRRTLDYLLTRSDVDAQRIGCIGFSFGAFRSQYLAALDPRIQASVSVCWTSTMNGIIDHNILGALGNFALPPRLYHLIDLVDIAASIAPKPFLAISGLKDPMLQPFGIAEAHLHLRKIWDEANAGERLGSLVYDEGHIFNSLMQKRAMAFLKRFLQVEGPAVY